MGNLRFTLYLLVMIIVYTLYDINDKFIPKGIVVLFGVTFVYIIWHNIQDGKYMAMKDLMNKKD